MVFEILPFYKKISPLLIIVIGEPLLLNFFIGRKTHFVKHLRVFSHIFYRKDVLRKNVGSLQGAEFSQFIHWMLKCTQNMTGLDSKLSKISLFHDFFS